MKSPELQTTVRVPQEVAKGFEIPRSRIRANDQLLHTILKVYVKRDSGWGNFYTLSNNIPSAFDLGLIKTYQPKFAFVFERYSFAEKWTEKIMSQQLPRLVIDVANFANFNGRRVIQGLF